MPTPMTDTLTTLGSGFSESKPSASRQPWRTSTARSRSARETVKVRSVLPSAEMFCTIMSTLIASSASGAKIAAAPPHGDLRFVAAVGEAADDPLFHDLILVDYKRPGRVGKGRQNLKAHPVVHRQLDRARLQYPRALRCHFEHFLVGDSTQLLRLGNDTRIGCVNTVDIGEDIAAFGVERGGKRDRRGIGAAAAERRPAAARADPLEPGDD